MSEARAAATALSQNLSFLKKKPTWLVFSVCLTGLLYLQTHFKISNRIKQKHNNLLVLEDLPDFLLCLFPCLFVAQLILAHHTLEIDVICDQVPGGQEMVVVDSLNEGLHLGLPFNFLCAHSPCHLEGISLNACNQSVRELLVLHHIIMITNQYISKKTPTFLPSSYCFTMIAFFPACLPASKITTRPGFILHKKLHIISNYTMPSSYSATPSPYNIKVIVGQKARKGGAKYGYGSWYVLNINALHFSHF